MNTEAQLQLRRKFQKETGMMWENSDEEPDIDYVEWLEAKVIAAQPDVIKSVCEHQWYYSRHRDSKCCTKCHVVEKC